MHVIGGFSPKQKQFLGGKIGNTGNMKGEIERQNSGYSRARRCGLATRGGLMKSPSRLAEKGSNGFGITEADHGRSRLHELLHVSISEERGIWFQLLAQREVKCFWR